MFWILLTGFVIPTVLVVLELARDRYLPLLAVERRDFGDWLKSARPA